MLKTRKKRCWGCGSLDVIKWGKQNIAIHRGLSKEHYKCYVKWYLHFNNCKQ